MVNYVRQQVKDGNTKLNVTSTAEFEDDKYLQPVLEDDALLFSLDDLPASTQLEDEIPASGDSTDADTSSEAKVAQLEKQLQDVQFQYAEYRHQVERTLEERWGDDSTGKSLTAQAGKPDYDGNYFDSYSYNGIFTPLD